MSGDDGARGTIGGVVWLGFFFAGTFFATAFFATGFFAAGFATGFFFAGAAAFPRAFAAGFVAVLVFPLAAFVFPLDAMGKERIRRTERR
jgi:hypothetical protein